jgi:hypothetical protein
MTQYSGRTTASVHKFDDWAEKDVSGVAPAIRQIYLFEVQWSDCPVEVETEVKKLWRWQELGNDFYYFSWDRDADAYIGEDELRDGGRTANPIGGVIGEDSKLHLVFPMIDEYLMSKGVEKCLIHWWW